MMSTATTMASVQRGGRAAIHGDGCARHIEAITDVSYGGIDFDCTGDRRYAYQTNGVGPHGQEDRDHVVGDAVGVDEQRTRHGAIFRLTAVSRSARRETVQRSRCMKPVEPLASHKEIVPSQLAAARRFP